MNSGHWTSGIYNMAEWVMRFVFLNVLWLFFTMGGLVVFSIFPATAAMFSVTRRWALGEGDIPVFRTFWRAFKESFTASLIIGYSMTAIGVILYLDFRYFFPREEMGFLVVKVLLGSATFLFIITLLFLFPVFAQFQLKPFEYMKNAFLISLSNVFHSLFMFAGTGLLVYVLLQYSGVMIIAGFSLVAYWNTWIAHMAFRRLEKWKNKKDGGTEMDE
jgi:uncharacterized membrane protein YesL